MVLGADQLDAIKADLQASLSQKRFTHTKSVVDTAMNYADIFEINERDKERLELAAWLHDVCKELQGEEMINLAKHYDIKIYTEDEAAANVLHARVGAAFVEDKYDIYDPEVLATIREHTLGEVKMSTMSKILYLADFTEPLRGDFCDDIRKLISDEKNLNKALLAAMDSKLALVLKKKHMIHPVSVEARNAILRVL